jgi:hypothetical protein
MEIEKILGEGDGLRRHLFDGTEVFVRFAVGVVDSQHLLAKRREMDSFRGIRMTPSELNIYLQSRRCEGIIVERKVMSSPGEKNVTKEIIGSCIFVEFYQSYFDGLIMEAEQAFVEAPVRGLGVCKIIAETLACLTLSRGYKCLHGYSERSNTRANYVYQNVIKAKHKDLIVNTADRNCCENLKMDMEKDILSMHNSSKLSSVRGDLLDLGSMLHLPAKL